MSSNKMSVLERFEGFESILLDSHSYTVFLLYDYGKTESEWFSIDCKSNISLLFQFLEKKISIRTLMDVFPVSMVSRRYGENNFLKSGKNLPDINDYPDEDSFLLDDVSSVLTDLNNRIAQRSIAEKTSEIIVDFVISSSFSFSNRIAMKKSEIIINTYSFITIDKRENYNILVGDLEWPLAA